MEELIEISFSPVNAFFSIMSIIMVFYWVLVIIAGLDPDLFSVDFDAADVDSDFNTESGTGNSGFMKVLEYFSFDELPMMFVITIVFFSMWFLGVNTTHYLGLGSSLMAFLLIIPNFIVSLFLVKLIAKPLGRLYKMVNHKGEPVIDFLGRRCNIITQIAPDKTGMVELTVNGNPIKLYARSNTDEEIAVGQQGVIVKESDDKKYYLVEKFDY
ncbi:OB-fold-containig protein [uncultured Flavobacterium sp.]|uniref:OB-fold-containig protein n=1 Tax=uncultured Flavobacterium sp. TaxID=165435 RepID=UPI0025EC201A|nr:OB-fold-containig protein [uncultured Flavobacterium sp.]